MRHDWRDTRPAWSLLYVIALFQAGLVALIEVSVGLMPSREKVQR